MQKKSDYIGELADYIKKNLKKGYTKDSLKFALINQGHSRMEVDKALKRVDQQLADDAPVLKTTPSITYEVIDPPVEQKPWYKRWFGL